jgi:hypothetical protein
MYTFEKRGKMIREYLGKNIHTIIEEYLSKDTLVQELLKRQSLREVPFAESLIKKGYLTDHWLRRNEFHQKGFNFSAMGTLKSQLLCDYINKRMRGEFLEGYNWYNSRDHIIYEFMWTKMFKKQWDRHKRFRYLYVPSKKIKYRTSVKRIK